MSEITRRLTYSFITLILAALLYLSVLSILGAAYAMATSPRFVEDTGLAPVTAPLVTQPQIVFPMAAAEAGSGNRTHS